MYSTLNVPSNVYRYIFPIHYAYLFGITFIWKTQNKIGNPSAGLLADT